MDPFRILIFYHDRDCLLDVKIDLQKNDRIRYSVGVENGCEHIPKTITFLQTITRGAANFVVSKQACENVNDELLDLILEGITAHLKTLHT